ncbi:MAG: hypothetical protein J0H51_22515 [Rhizobiales bacterium]|nr:hypothetical protein [Hyphomicrobiales bacterium]
MVVKRTTKPVKSPAGTARAGVNKRAVKKTTVKKAAAKKTTAARVVKTVAKTSTKPSTKTSTKAVAAKTVATRKVTIAKTQRLVDATPLVIDDGDDVAKAKVALLREAKARAPDHQGRAKRSAVERANDPPPAAGQALIERVSRAIERELTQIEVIVGGQYVAPRQRTEAERRARTLASLARTLRDVTTLQLSEKKEKREDDDAVPRDLSELRLALARRLDQLVADAKTAHPEAPE